MFIIGTKLSPDVHHWEYETSRVWDNQDSGYLINSRWIRRHQNQSGWILRIWQVSNNLSKIIGQQYLISCRSSYLICKSLHSCIFWYLNILEFLGIVLCSVNTLPPNFSITLSSGCKIIFGDFLGHVNPFFFLFAIFFNSAKCLDCRFPPDWRCKFGTQITLARTISWEPSL